MSERTWKELFAEAMKSPLVKMAQTTGLINWGWELSKETGDRE